MIQKIFTRFRKLFQYLFYSILSTILDTAIVWVLYSWLDVNITAANTVGVVAGFVLSYVLSTRQVFDTDYGISGFLVYFGTFLFGLVLADVLITVSNQALVPHLAQWLAFLVSKGISVVLPFFILYFLRKFLYQKLNQRRDRHE